MDSLPAPLVFFFLLFSGWVSRQQQAVIDYLLEENRVLHAAQGSRPGRPSTKQDIRTLVVRMATENSPTRNPVITRDARHLAIW